MPRAARSGGLWAVIAANVEFDPYSVQSMEDPYPVYRALLAQDRLYHNVEHGFWALFRHAEVQACARDWETFSSRDGVDLSGSVGLAGPGGFLDMDPPRHDELRRIVRERFTPSAVRGLEGIVRELVRPVVDRLVARGGGDLAAELARPLPLQLICTLLGFPRENHGDLGRWFDAMVRRTPGSREPPEEAREAAGAMRDYLAVAAAQRCRGRPGDDLLGDLVAAEERGELTAQERTGVCVLLFLAGISTAAGLLSTSLYLLASEPEQRAALVREPSLVPGAVEELLRYVSPVQALARTTARAVELNGTVLPEGARVLLVHGAANRDPRRFPDPDTLNVRRQPERNLGFGEGIHFCLGAHLARLQARVVLDMLLPAMPDYSLDGPVRWMTTPGDRGIDTLPVSIP